jgi:hypothetical protein
MTTKAGPGRNSKARPTSKTTPPMIPTIVFRTRDDNRSRCRAWRTFSKASLTGADFIRIKLTRCDSDGNGGTSARGRFKLMGRNTEFIPRWLCKAGKSRNQFRASRLVKFGARLRRAGIWLFDYPLNPQLVPCCECRSRSRAQNQCARDGPSGTVATSPLVQGCGRFCSQKGESGARDSIMCLGYRLTIEAPTGSALFCSE